MTEKTDMSMKEGFEARMQGGMDLPAAQAEPAAQELGKGAREDVRIFVGTEEEGVARREGGDEGMNPDSSQSAGSAGDQTAFEKMVRGCSLGCLFGPLGVQLLALLAWILKAALAAASRCRTALRAAACDGAVCRPAGEALEAVQAMRDAAARDARAAGAPGCGRQDCGQTGHLSLEDAVRSAVETAARPASLRASWGRRVIFEAAGAGAEQVQKDIAQWGGGSAPAGGREICDAACRLFSGLALLARDSAGLEPTSGACVSAGEPGPRTGRSRLLPEPAGAGRSCPGREGPAAGDGQATTIHEDVAGVARTKDKEQDMNAEMNMQESFEAVNQSGMELLSAEEQQKVQDLDKGVRESVIPSASAGGVETESREEAEMDPRKQPWDCEPYKTAEECMEAIGDDGGAELAMLPYEKRSAEVCLAAVKADKGLDYPGALFYVPEELKTADLCRAAVETRPNALEFVPEELKSLELCKLAVKGDPMAMGYAPDAYANELIDFIKAEIPNYEEYGACILD